jgi:pilus assembly protein CpaB
VNGGTGGGPRSGRAAGRSALRTSLRTGLRAGLRAGLRHRRALAAALAAAAVAAGVSVLSPAGPATAAVLTAARDLPWGARLTGADLRRVALPVGVVPDGAVVDEADARGRLLAGPVRRGEPITDVRLVGPGLLAGPGASDTGDLVATPVRIADAEAAALLHAGDTVDVLASAEGPDAATVVAPAVRVLAVPRDDAAGAVLADGALVVLATSPAVAARLARAATTSRLSIVLRAA